MNPEDVRKSLNAKLATIQQQKPEVVVEKEIVCPNCHLVVDELFEDPKEMYPDGICKGCLDTTEIEQALEQEPEVKTTAVVTQVQEEVQLQHPMPKPEALPDETCTECGKPLYYREREGSVSRHYHESEWEKREMREDAHKDFFTTAYDDGVILDPALLPEYVAPEAIIKLSDWTPWRSLVQALSTVVEEAKFSITGEGISHLSMDPSHVALIDARIPYSACMTFEHNRDFDITLQVDDIIKGLKDLDKKETLEITIGDDKVRFQAGGDSFTRFIIESTQGAVPLPKLSLDAKFTVDTKEFLKVLKKVEKTSDHITIHMDREKIIFSGKSDSGEFESTWNRGHPYLVQMTSKEEEVKATYSIDYLKKIMDALKDSDIVTIEYSVKMPLKATFKLGEYDGKLEYYLAPRIQE